MKPVFNYDISVLDCINQITNEPRHGMVKMIFPASCDDRFIRDALNDISNAGICKFNNDDHHENSGTDQDLYYEVLVTGYEDYMIFVRELITSWDLMPIAITYIPSKEEAEL